MVIVSFATLIIVPDPGVKPAGPYSTSHDVPEPAVQVTSTLVLEVEMAIKAEEAKQLGASITLTSSIEISPVKEAPLSASKTKR
jgi:hypothetical protein